MQEIDSSFKKFGLPNATSQVNQTTMCRTVSKEQCCQTLMSVIRHGEMKLSWFYFNQWWYVCWLKWRYYFTSSI